MIWRPKNLCTGARMEARSDGRSFVSAHPPRKRRHRSHNLSLTKVLGLVESASSIKLIHPPRSVGRCAADCGRSTSSRPVLYPSRAGVAELEDARDLKSRAPKGACGFDPRPRHHISHLDTASYHFPPSLLLLSPSGKLGALHARLSELCAVLLIPSRGRNEYCPDAGLSTLWNLVSQEGSEAWTA